MALREEDANVAGVITAACTTSLETMIKTPGLHWCMPDHLQSTALPQGKTDCTDWGIRSWFANYGLCLTRHAINLGCCKIFFKAKYLELWEIHLMLRVNFCLCLYLNYSLWASQQRQKWMGCPWVSWCPALAGCISYSYCKQIVVVSSPFCWGWEDKDCYPSRGHSPRPSWLEEEIPVYIEWTEWVILGRSWLLWCT